MIYWMIRHKASGEFMPELKRTRGYSWWNPAKVNIEELLGKKVLGTPRLFAHKRNAHRAIVQWYAFPNGRTRGYQNHYGEWDEDISTEDDGRTKNDLEVVPVNIEVIDEREAKMVGEGDSSSSGST